MTRATKIALGRQKQQLGELVSAVRGCERKPFQRTSPDDARVVDLECERASACCDVDTVIHSMYAEFLLPSRAER